MSWKEEWKALLIIVVVFTASFFVPVGSIRFDGAVLEAFHLLKDYAREHVVLCLLPALFIAGAISVFISQNAVMKYLGPKAKKVVAYSVASVSGAILAVCSCTILPLFTGIYKRGAGLGPAIAFLYSGPAINVLAIILTARILGFELGIARAIGAVVFSVIIGLLMHLIFLKEEKHRQGQGLTLMDDLNTRPLWQTLVYFALMVLILIFANWARPAAEESNQIWIAVFNAKWLIVSVLSVLFGIVLVKIMKMNIIHTVFMAISVIIFSVLFKNNPLIPFAVGIIGLGYFTAKAEGELNDWMTSTWDFTKQILPLLFIGVVVAGFLLGRPEQEGVIPSEWVSAAVGGNSLISVFFASIAGAFMYFATLTEVPILQGLIGNGMGKGPALALLLAGPALSLPSMLVIRAVIGNKKTIVYVALVCVMATISGFIYGSLF